MPSRNPKIWMWAEACELLERAERVQRSLFQVGQASSAWQPPADIYETRDELVIMIALPGVAVDRLQLAVEAGTLVVVGVRSLPSALRQAVIHRLEIPHGRFERRIELPPGRFALEYQELVDGCLSIGLRKL